MADGTQLFSVTFIATEMPVDVRPGSRVMAAVAEAERSRETAVF